MSQVEVEDDGPSKRIQSHIYESLERAGAHFLG